MTTQKQNAANQKNALLSTGPTTIEGKAIVSMNATKHGIFTKELIVASGVGKENEVEYFELLNNLIICLTPTDQIQSLLVEKISIDFWRLKRVIKFETGSIREYLDEITNKYYSIYSNQPNEKIDKTIDNKRSIINQNNCYIECLQKQLVSFNTPIWKGMNITSDILDDFYFIANSIETAQKTKEEREKLYHGQFDFIEMQEFLKTHGFNTDKEISSRLVDLYLKKNQKLEDEIRELEQKKLENIKIDELNSRICAIPRDENIDKVMKYEKSIQKSIFQNLFLLKKLQGLL